MIMLRWRLKHFCEEFSILFESKWKNSDWKRMISNVLVTGDELAIVLTNPCVWKEFHLLRGR